MHPVRTSTPRSDRRERRGRAFLAAAASLAVAASGLAALVIPAQAATPQPTTPVTSPNGRGDVILNMFQWSWTSIAAECTSTIGPAGYGYVQTSPPQEHVQGTEWWTSYQPVSYKLESKLGSRAEFKNMVDTCEAAGVGIIADAVVNHMAGADRGGGTGTGGSSFSIENYPGLYGPNDFNDCKENIGDRYGDRYVVQNCRLVSLQDLRTGSDYVRTKIAGYFNDLISLGVKGFRIDAAKHIPAGDLAAIKQKLSNPNVFWVHEVIGASGEPIQPSEYLGSGDSHEFDYARRLKNDFDGQIKNLRYVADGKLPSDRAGVFVDNHDTERNGETMNYKWGAKYLLGNVFMLSWPYGSPSVYTGYTFTNTDHGAPGASASDVPDASCSSSAWTCMHAKTEITGMVGFHNSVAGTSVTNWWDDGNNQIAYGRGAKGYVAINNTGGSTTRTYQTSLPAGTYCDVVGSATCSKTLTVNGSGQVTATIPAYGAFAIHVGKVPGGTTPTPTDPPATGDLAVYYSTAKGWDAYKIHYKVGSGSWTSVPGVDLAPACTGWVSRTITNGASGVTAVFNNGSGTWDNNGSQDYALAGAVAAVSASGAVSSTNPCGSTPTPTPTPTPTTPAQQAASFSVNATTTWGQDVYVVGSIPALGSWSTASAVKLSSATYPVWAGTLTIPASTSFEYKFIKKDGSGNVVWESGANRTGATASNGTFTVSTSWK